MLNKVMLLGHVGKDPELQITESGLNISKFSIATNEWYKTKDSNEWKQKTTWHNICAFGNKSEHVQKKITKGVLVFLEGKISNKSYTNNDGVKTNVSEIYIDKFQVINDKFNKDSDEDEELDVIGEDVNLLEMTMGPPKKLDKVDPYDGEAYNGKPIDDDLPF